MHPAEPTQEKLTAPVQFFTQRPLQAKLFKGSNDSRFTCVAVIWLPEVHSWRRTDGTQNQYLDVLFKVLKCSINQRRLPKVNCPEKLDRHDRWVFMGPSDSDGLAFYQKYPPQAMSSENADLSIVPYRATIAQPILDLLPKDKEDKGIPSPVEFRPLHALAGHWQV